MRNRLYSPNGSLHPVVKMSASELSCKHYEMEGDNLWWTGILSRGCSSTLRPSFHKSWASSGKSHPLPPGNLKPDFSVISP